MTGGIVQKIRQPADGLVVLQIRTPGRSDAILLSVVPDRARMHLTEGAFTGPDRPPAFCALLRKHLIGARIEKIVQTKQDRVVRLDFGRPRSGEHACVTAELFSRGGNLALLDSEDRLLGSMYPFRSGRRGMRVGSPYLPPPPPSASKPLEARSFSDLEGDFNRRVDATYRMLAERLELEGRRSAILRGLGKAILKLERKRGEIERNLQRAGGAERLRKMAALLQSSPGSVSRGAGSVRLPDLFEDGAPELEIPLDPTLDAVGNAERMFVRARKLDRSRKHLAGFLSQTNRDLEEAARLRNAAAKAASLGDLDGLKSSLTSIGIADAAKKPGRAKRGVRRGEKALGREFVSAEGIRILAGRNDRENHRITFEVARGNDYWLHVRGRSGSHVVVLLPRGGELGNETLLDAAHIALHYSSAKSEDSADVLYVRRKHVHHPKGEAPGRVVVHQERVIHLRKESRRLARLLGSANP